MEVKENNFIQVFEHDYLKVGEQGFGPAHFDALVRLNEQHGNKYFTVGLKRIKFNSYVGVLQVKGKTIEVLPKADKTGSTDSAKKKWKSALLSMLKVCKGIDLHPVSNANLSLKKSSLLDLYVNNFLKEVDTLLHKGLIKKYRREKENSLALKGKLIFSEHISKNYIHKERFYTEHQTYDSDVLLNQILKRALVILRQVSYSSSIRSKVHSMLLHFDGIADVQIKEAHLNSLPTLNHKTSHYETALQLARLIILQYNPDFSSGQENTIALLLDMNELFEEYIYEILRKELNSTNYKGYSIKTQSKRLFWGNQTIRPDIILTNIVGKKIVIDTKWKIVNDYRPSDADLKQMYAYNIHFGASKSILLYPKSLVDIPLLSNFHKSVLMKAEHSCGLFFADIFENDGKLKANAARNILNYAYSN
ncbi:McrC family protein [Rufibacter aurantiacus]|uniref:McrC family protein n=1 Tax=Rufibacter aurantiacus TaxID=2817374 RepID=UPI001B30ED29|nr:hypothetical protein [Rufibacter aurantiacus]